ncbi:MAG: hypothetical protein HY273_00475 [Gammaproteobacteria bacterium]|nr:hypothetical protein [Gammaproteobacteria bacterium]
MPLTLILSIGTFIAILALLLVLRARNSTLEIRATDIVVATLPVLMFLLVSGKIQKLEFGEGGVKIETAFVKASVAEINSQVTAVAGLPMDTTLINPKEAISAIPQLIEKKTEGLSFRLGYGGYAGPAILDYLARLTAQPYLKYIIIENSDGSFFGMADARQLYAMLTNPYGQVKADELARWLANGNRPSFNKLPGFIAAEHAAKPSADKTQTLQLMEQLNVDILPVINEQKIYLGVINRARLVASVILDVAKDLKK